MKRAARRYAKALFDLAVASDQRDRVGADMDALLRLIRSSPEFAAFVAMPIAGSGARLDLLDRLLRAGLHPLSWRFVRFLLQKRRLNLLPDVAVAFAGLADRLDGILAVTLASPYPLGSPETAGIAERFTARTGLRARIETKHDPALIGGFVLGYEDRLCDFSLAGALQQLQRQWTSRAAEPGIQR